MNERILIVDDEASIHEVARAYLERDGFIVYSAYDGREGLEIALTKRPTLIVLDLMLPDLSGEEICREVRSRSDVPIPVALPCGQYPPWVLCEHPYGRTHARRCPIGASFRRPGSAG
jgi:DNA-binding NtrC family response regulator